MADLTLKPITALAHLKGDGVDRLLLDAAGALTALGLRVAGVVQRARPGQSECCSEFFLEDLASGAQHEISQRLGREARGCRLDYGRLAEAHAGVERALRAGADVLIVNRFGYSEAQGGGFRPLIEIALERELPVLTSLNGTYAEAWQLYCGDFGRVVEATPAALGVWLAAVRSQRRRTNPGGARWAISQSSLQITKTG